MSDLTPDNLVTMMLDFIVGLSDAEREHEMSVQSEPRLHEAYIKAKADAWKKVEGRSREEREAYVDADCVDQRIAYERAVGKSKFFLEKIKNTRAQISALQSASNQVKELSQHARMGPD